MRIYCKVVLRLVSQAINNIQAGVVVEAEAEVEEEIETVIEIEEQEEDIDPNTQKVLKIIMTMK